MFVKQGFRWLKNKLIVPDFFALFEEQANVARECLPVLNAIRRANTINQDWDKIMQDIEHRADAATSKIIVCAERLFSTPFDTEDIYELAVRFDDVVDIVEDLCVKVVDYRLLPDDTLQRFFGHVEEGISYICNGVCSLRGLQNIRHLRHEMKECEHAADRMIRPIIRKSRNITLDDLLPYPKDEIGIHITHRELLLVIDRFTYREKYREIAELAEEAVDACTKVFHVLGNIYLKEM